jgi:hypothetical protein
VSSPLLLAIVEAHAWQQYKYLATACLTSPSLYSDCSRVYEGYGILDAGSAPYDIGDPYGGQVFNYQYTSVAFYGFNRANYTLVGPVLRNSTAALMYASCFTNSTCNATMSTYSPATVQSTLNTYIAATFNAMLDLIPANGTRLYQPSYSPANMMSIFTSATSWSNEIYGVHDLVTLAAADGKLTLAGLEALQKLAIYLKGGPSVYENMMNRLAFYGYGSYSHTIYDPAASTNTRRDYESLSDGGKSKHGIPRWRQDRFDREQVRNSITYIDKYQDLLAVSKLRGRDRGVLMNMTMDKYVASSSKEVVRLVQPRTCGASDGVQRTIDNLISIAQGTCDVIGIANNIFDIGQIATDASLMTKWMPALGKFGSAQLSLMSIVATATSNLCNIAGTQSPCFPSPVVYSLDLYDKADSVLGLIGDFAKVGTPGGALVIGADIACATLPLAIDTYQQAAKCCGSNCASVACFAASLQCAISGMPC